MTEQLTLTLRGTEADRGGLPILLKPGVSWVSSSDRQGSFLGFL